MALDPGARYSGQLATDANYPYGKAQNVTVEGDGTGTPFEADLVNDLLGFQQALLVEADITPSGTPDNANTSQYLEAVRVVGGKRLLIHRALREWQAVALPYQANPRDCHYPFLVSPKLPNMQSTIFAVGWNTADSARFSYARSFDGTVFDAEPVGASTTEGSRCVATGADGEFISGVVGSGQVVSHTELGRIKDFETLPTDTPSAVYYARYCATYLSASATGKIYFGSDLADLVANTPFSAATSFTTSTLGVAGGEFADDDSANIIHAGESTISAVTRQRIMHSADDGETWTVAMTCAGGITGINVAWHPIQEKFVALDSAGNFYTSPTGLVWTLTHAATSANAAAGASTRYGTLAIAGECIAKVFNPTLYTDYSGPGVIYSFDMGATWRTQIFGYGFDFTSDFDVSENPEPILSLLSVNDRLFATDGFRVYRSGLLAFEPETA